MQQFVSQSFLRSSDGGDEGNRAQNCSNGPESLMNSDGDRHTECNSL